MPITPATRFVCLDTETTGLSSVTDRVCEIAAMEFDPVTFKPLSRFHVYLNPCRPMPYGAYRVHGLSDRFLADKPLFKSVAGDFLDFVSGSVLYIHNASFDRRMLDAELARLALGPLCEHVVDIRCTLQMARRLRGPGTRNGLDALCDVYGVDRSCREAHHGALIDTELLLGVVEGLYRHGAPIFCC